MDKDDKLEPIYLEPVKTREGNDDIAILREARERASQAWRAWRDDYEQSKIDVRFAGGDQWTAQEVSERQNAGKVTLTLNKLPQYINRVVGSQRKTVQSIQVSPKTSAMFPNEALMKDVNGEDIKISQVVADFVRDIEYSSNARSAYKMAFKHAVDGGIGWLRVYTAYEKEGFNQEIRIKGIRDRYSVFIDKKAKEADYSDMNYAFIVEHIPKQEFYKRYPNALEGGLDIMDGDESTFWATEDTIAVAEYFRREPYKKKIVLLSNGEIVDREEYEEVKETLAEQGISILKERKVDSYKVLWCKITGNQVLEKDREFPSETIPIVPVLGREIDIDGNRVYHSLVYHARDAQRMLNATRSTALERINLISKTPFIAEDKAIEGYERMWSEANVKNYGVLKYKAGRQAPQRQPMAGAPVGEMQMGEVLNYDIQSSIGMYGASLGEQTNEISGKAIRSRQTEAEEGTFDFVDNLETAIRRVGLLVVELLPKIYDTNRLINLRSADGQTRALELNKEVEDENGEVKMVNSFDNIKFDVVVSAGASYQTRQEEASSQILELMKVNPQVAQVAPDMLVKNLDFADSDAIAERLKKTVPLNLLTKQEQEEIQKDAPPPQPSPEEQLVQGEMQLKQLELQGKQQELQMKLEIEKMKVEQAKLNLAMKEYEAKIKAMQTEKGIIDADEKRKDEIATQIAEGIKREKDSNSDSSN